MAFYRLIRPLIYSIKVNGQWYVGTNLYQIDPTKIYIYSFLSYTTKVVFCA